jgi:hypothetical protein
LVNIIFGGIMKNVMLCSIVLAICFSINCNLLFGNNLFSAKDSLITSITDTIAVKAVKTDSIVIKDTTKIQVKAKPDSAKVKVIQTSIKPEAYDTATLDKFVKKTGVFFYGTFVSKNLYEINYKKPGENIVKKVSTADFSRIYHRNGKIDIIDYNPQKNSKNWVVQNSEQEWQRVKIVAEEDKVAGMTEKGEIEAEYIAKKLNNSDNELLEKNAIIVLKKKAFSLKANYVLVKTKNIERNYGEMPSIKMTGIAYLKEESTP